MDQSDLAWFAYSSGYLVVALVFLFIAKLLFDFATPYCLKDNLTEKDNAAVGIHLAGYMMGLLAIICSVFAGEAVDPSLAQFKSEMIDVGIHLGIVVRSGAWYSFVGKVDEDDDINLDEDAKEEVIVKGTITDKKKDGVQEVWPAEEAKNFGQGKEKARKYLQENPNHALYLEECILKTIAVRRKKLLENGV